MVTRSLKEAIDDGYIIYRVESDPYNNYVRYCHDNNLPLISLRVKTSFGVVAVEFLDSKKFTETGAISVENILRAYDERKERPQYMTAQEGGVYTMARRVPLHKGEKVLLLLKEALSQPKATYSA